MSVDANIQYGPFYGFFYKVKDSNNHTRGYVLGSFHTLTPYELSVQWKEKIQRCFDKSHALVVECDVFAPIFNKLTASQLRSAIESKGLMDSEMLLRAYEREMPIYELEAYEKQQKFVEDFGKEFFRNSLAGYSPPNYETSRWNLLEAIRTSNEDLMKGIADEGLSPEFSERFYDKRNKEMTEKIDGLIKDQRSRFFIVAGAGHVIGKQGIPSLLSSRGWVIKKYTEAV